jgi:hypothetical protein
MTTGRNSQAGRIRHHFGDVRLLRPRLAPRATESRDDKVDSLRIDIRFPMLDIRKAIGSNAPTRNHIVKTH